jgi:acetoin utilization protein AcuB
MRIKHVMTPNPVVVHPDTPIVAAQKLMKEKNIRRLLVTEKDKLVGVVTKHDLIEASPSPATSLSVWEINYLWAEMKVKDVMTTNPLTFPPDMPFERVMKIGQERKIATFPVVDNGKVLGIATESDLIRMILTVIGMDEEGCRITIEGVEMKPGNLAKIAETIASHKTVILSLIDLPGRGTNESIMVMRLKTSDPKPIVDDLRKAGWNVTDVFHQGEAVPL